MSLRRAVATRCDRRLRHGANVNFEDLYRRHADDVFRFACWLCGGDRAEAEDVVSETFLRAWTNDQRIEVSTVKGYLFTIARNVLLNRNRRRRPGTSHTLAAQADTTSPGPARAAEQRDELAAAMAAVQALPEAERAALLLRAQHEMPYDEIARTLGISLAAAKVNVHRARLRLAARRPAQPEVT